MYNAFSISLPSATEDGDIETFRLTSAQKTTAVMKLADTLLDLLGDLREDDRNEFGDMVKDVSKTMRTLARDIARGDPDVALEIIKSSSRLVVTLRLAAAKRPKTSQLH
ncbi:hypothetical protein RCCGE510_05002 [Rhizobium sp. CCGE 510]|nr:hypothetical protein RCCGE510_05002 [Rhizobium sp. CCGE 510]